MSIVKKVSTNVRCVKRVNKSVKTVKKKNVRLSKNIIRCKKCQVSRGDKMCQTMPKKDQRMSDVSKIVKKVNRCQRMSDMSLCVKNDKRYQKMFLKRKRNPQSI